MVLGDLTSTTPSQASVDSVADVIGWKFALDRQDPRGSTQYQSLGGPRYAEGAVVQLPRILGHRDVGQTGCPGSRLYARLGEIRNKRSEEHTSELQSLMRISYAVFCLKKKKLTKTH